MRARRWQVASLLIVGLLLAGCPRDDGDDGGDGASEPDGQGGGGGGDSVLAEVQERDEVVCGINEAVPGFGLVTDEGDYEGFDIDFCKVVAAAVLGDPSKVEYVSLTSEQRFTALQGGEIDVLIRNTTWTASRDGTEGAAFATTTFYDSQGMMVAADSDVQTLEDLDRATICVLTGTTTELNLETQFQRLDLRYTPLPQEENDLLQEAYLAGRCDAWTSDKSQLAGIRSAWPENEGGPEALRILDVTMSKEPLGPVVRDGDSDWLDAVNWAVLATIQAEEFGITSANVDQHTDSDDPAILSFLGQPTEEGGTLDPGLGLPTDFAYQVVKQVGNYGEIYDRTVGADSPLQLQRDLNRLWTEGGLHYAPPFR